MKAKTFFLIAAITALIALVLFLWHNAISSRGIIISAGIVFILAGALTALMSRRSLWQSKVAKTLTMISSVAAVIGGIALLYFNEEAGKAMPTVFAIATLFGAIWQFIVPLNRIMAGETQWAWLFTVPAALVGTAVYLFLLPNDAISDPQAMFGLGISLTIVAIASVIEGFLLRKGAVIATPISTPGAQAGGAGSSGSLSVTKGSTQPLDPENEG